MNYYKYEEGSYGTLTEQTKNIILKYVGDI